jgi:hypothetical protein
VKANELLLWLSARREGSWQQFRAAVEKLHLADNDSEANEITTADGEEFPLHQRLRLNLECLAHVEFFAEGCKEGWRVTPPTLAVHPVPTGFRAVLCGARSPALRERVLLVGEKLGCEILDPDGIPEVIRFVADDISTLSEAATQAGIYFQPDFPWELIGAFTNSIQQDSHGEKSNVLKQKLCVSACYVSLFTFNNRDTSYVGRA